MRNFFFTFIVILLSVATLTGQIPQRMAGLNKLKAEVVTDSVRNLLHDLEIIGGKYENAMAKYLLDSMDMNAEARFIAMRHYAKTTDEENQRWFDRCLDYARRYDLDRYLSSIYVLKSEFYKRERHYDSAMLSILKAGELARQFDDIEQQANVLHLTGDLFYNTGLYDEAKQYYLQLNELKGRPEVWEEWRKRVVRNDLAMIERQTGNYPQAEAYLMESFNEMGSRINTRADSLYLAYLQLQHAEILVNTHGVERAGRLADSAYQIYSAYHDHTGCFNAAYINALLAQQLQDDDRFEFWTNKAFALASRITVLPETYNELLMFKAHIMVFRHKPDSTLFYLKKYAFNMDSLLRIKHAAHIQQIKSGYEYRIAQTEIQALNTEKVLLLVMMLVFLFFLAIITSLYLKLRKKNQLLVAMSVEALEKEISEDGNADQKCNETDAKTPQDKPNQSKDDPKMIELVGHFKQLMDSEKRPPIHPLASSQGAVFLINSRQGYFRCGQHHSKL